MIFGKYINRYYLRHAPALLLGILALLMVDYIQLLVPQLYRLVINGVNLGQVVVRGETMPFTKEVLFQHICLPMIWIVLFMVVGRFLWRICFFGTSIRVQADLREKMFDHSRRLSQQYYQVNKVGNLMSLYTNDLDTIQECFGDGILMFFDALVLGLLALYRMWCMDRRMTILALIPAAFMFAIGTVMGKTMTKTWEKRQQAFSDLSDFAQENFSGIAVIKAFVKELKEMNDLFACLGLAQTRKLLTSFSKNSFYLLPEPLRRGEFLTNYCVNYRTIKSKRNMKSILDNRPELAHEVNKVAEVAGYLWQKGWAERNGGNITVNITEYADDEIRNMPAISEVKQIGVTLPHLKGCYFYCKGTNMRMRDLARRPMDNGSVIRILDDCASYVIIADKPVQPTSEVPSHLSVHNYLISKGSPYKASVHTHPIELIALSHNKKFMEKDVATNLLWSMIPETKAFCPRGLGMIPYALPSSVELAEATIKELADYDVVMWEKHGIFAVDRDVMAAFDQIDVLNKSALIYIAAKNMGFEPDGMSQEQMKEMSVAFNLPK